ncbi:MAG: putative transporter permease/ATP-binding protein [Rhodospirillales bacterium]|nr:putative transporter permease/ATP-binding protein [Rhodospirillales bacterium]
MDDSEFDARVLAVEGFLRLPRALWRAAAGRRLSLLVYLVLLAGAQVVMLAIPLLFGRAIDAVQRGGEANLIGAVQFMGLVLGAALLSWALHGPARVLERSVALQVRRRVAAATVRHALSLPLAWHDRTHSGETIDRLTRAVTALHAFAENTFIYIQSAVALIGPILALCVLSWAVGTAAILGYLAIFAIMMRFDKRVVALVRAQNEAERRYAASLIDCLGNAQTILTLRLEQPAQATVADRLETVFGPLARLIRVNEGKWCAVDLLNAFMRTGVVLLYGFLSWRLTGSIAVGSLLAAYQYTQQAGGVVSSMAGNLQALVRYHVDFGGLGDLLREEPAKPVEATVPPHWRRIQINGLSFTHAGADRPVLSEVSLGLARGRRVALVGESGSGKSTILTLLAGLRTPDRMAITVDGADVLHSRELGRLGMLIPQEPQLFEGTVLQNITLGIVRGDEEVARACRLSRFDRVLELLPGGLAAPVQERGANLSGGQRQRLALARAILAAGDAPLLLLDEPTSSLDPATEAAVYDNLFAAFETACIVSSIHRLHLLDRFDEIVFLAEGRIVDAGGLDDLLARQPGFRALYAEAVGGDTADRRVA